MTPLPQLDWHDDEWVGNLAFGSWGTVEMTVVPSNAEKKTEPIASQKAAIRHLLEHSTQVQTKLLTELARHYKRMRPRYRDFLGPEMAKLMPDLPSLEELHRLIDLLHIYVHPDAKKGVSYVGFQFDCTWDREHGLGAIMLGEDVVEIEGADIAFSWWPS